MADLEELLIKVNSDLGDLSGIDSAVKALEGLRDFSAKAEKGARSLMGLSAAFVALNREGKNTTGISNLKNQVESLIGILDRLANHTKNADKAINQLGSLGDALKKFAGVGESLKGLDGITKGVNDMVGVLGALGKLGSASKSIKGVGNIGKDLNNAAKNVSKGSDKLNKELDKVGKVLDKTEKQTSKDMKIDVSVSVADNNKNLNQVINENQKLEGLVKSRHEVLKEYAKVNKQFYETRESLTTADVLSGSKDHTLDALEKQANNLWGQIEDLNKKIQEMGGKEIHFPTATAFTDIDEKIGAFKSYKKIIADSEAELAKFGKKVAEQNPLQVDDIIQTNKEDTKSVDGFTDAISNISSALDNVDNISKGIANLEKLGEALHSFNGFDENVKSLNSVAMGIRNLLKAVAESEGLNENSFGFIVHIKNALDTLANNSAGYGNIGSATTGLSKLLEALNSAKSLDLSKLDQVKEKMLELNNDEFKRTAHELSTSLKELNDAFNLLDSAHDGVIGGMGTITQGFQEAASGLYNVREQIEIISQDFDSVLSPVLNSRLIEILETFRSMNDSYKNVSGIAQGLGSLLAVLLNMQEKGIDQVDATPIWHLLDALRELANSGTLLEEVSQKFEKFQGISDAMARLFNAMKYFAIPLDPNQHTVFSYLKGEIEKFNTDVAGKFDETRNLLYGFKGVFEALQKDSSVVKEDNLFVVLKKQIEDFASLDVGANLKPIGNFLNGVAQIAKAMQDGKGLNQSSPLFEDLKKQLNDLYDWTSRSGSMLDDFGKLANLLRSITDLVNTLGKGVTFSPDNNVITNVVGAINGFDDSVLAKAETISKTFNSLGTMIRSMQKLFWANTRNVSGNLDPIKNFVLEIASLKDDLMGIEKPIASLSRLMSSVGDASSKVSVEDNALKAIQFQIESIAKNAPQMAEAEKAIGNLTRLVDAVAASNKKVGDTNSLSRIAEGVKQLGEVQNVEKIGNLASNLTKLVDVMSKNQWDGRKNTAIDKIASGLKKFNEVSDLGKVSSLAKDIKKLIETVAQNEDKVGKDNVITRLVTSLQGFKDINEQTKGLKGTLSAIEKLIRVASEDVDFGKNNPLSQLKRILGGFSDINKGTKGLDKVVKTLMQAIEVMKMVNGKEFNIDPVNNPFALLKEQLEKFVDIIPQLENFPKVLKAFKDFIKEFDASKKFSIDPQPIMNVIGAISYAQNLGGAVTNFKEMISAIGKLTSKGNSNTLAGIGQSLGLINKNIAPFAQAGKLQSLVDIANSIVKLKDVDVGKIKEIATAIRDIMSAIGQINGSNNTIKINLDERGIINAEKGFQNAHRSWEDFRNDVLREVQDIDFSQMFEFDEDSTTKSLREQLKKAQQEMKNAQKEAQKWHESMKKTENIKTPEGAKNVEAYRRAYQNYWQAWTSAGKYKEIVEQLNKVLSARNGYELENDAQGYRARKSLTEERKRLTEMLESMSKNAPSLRVFGDEQGQSAALDTIYDRIRQIDQDLIGINEELPRVGESVEGIKVQTEQLSEVWDEVLKKQREARADISEGFGNFGGLLQGSGNKVLGSVGNLSSMFGKAVEKYGENFSASTIAALTKVAGVLKTLTTALNQVIAVVNVVIAIFKAWWDITGKMVDALKQFLQQCIDFAKKMLNAVVGAFNAVAGAVKKVASVVQSAAQLIQDALRKIGEFGGKVISVFGKIGHAVAPAVKGIKAVLSAVTPKFIKTLASGNLQLSKIIKNSHLLGGAIKKITQYFSMMSRMLMRKSITAFLNKMKQAFEDMVMFEKNSNDSMLNLNTNVSKVFSELRRAANQWIAAFEPLINAVAPHVVNFLANIQAMGENVAKFMAILTGQPYYLRAKRFYEDYGESLDETKKKAKDLTNGLDELNILNDSKDSSDTGISPEDMFEKVPVDGNLQFPEFNIDGIIDSIIDWFDSIPWEEIKQKARDLADRLFDILDAVLRRRDFWYKLGEFFGEGINTALAFIGRAIERWNPAETEAALSALIQGLVDTIDWEYTNAKVRELARKIADFWNAVFKDDELWERIQKVAHELCRDIIDFFRDFAWTFDFSNFATRFTEELRKFLYNFPYTDLEEAVGAWVKGFVDFFNTAAKNKPFWKQLGESIAKFITATIAKALKELTNADLAEMADSLALAIKTALENIPWTDIDNSIQTIADHIADALIKVFTDEQLLTDISKAVGKIASTIIRALNRIVRRVRNKAREIGQKIARALKKGFAEIPWDEVFTLPANILNTISAFFAGILDEIPSGAELANWITNKLIMGIDAVDWDLIYDNLMRLAEKLRDFISGVLQNGEFWQKAGEVTGKVITFTLDFLFELVNIKGEDLGTAITNYINSLIDNINIGKYLSKTVDVAINLVTALDVVLTGVNWNELGDQISQGIVDAIDKIWQNRGLIQKTIEDAFSVVNNLIKQTLLKMLENNSFYKIGESIGDILMGVINGLYEFFVLNGDLIIEGIGDLAESLSNYLRSHHDEIVAKLNKIIDSIVDILETFFDEKSGVMSELFDILEEIDVSRIIYIVVKEALMKLLAKLKLHEAIWKAMEDSGFLKAIWDAFTNVLGKFWDWFKKKLAIGFLRLIFPEAGLVIDLANLFKGIKFTGIDFTSLDNAWNNFTKGIKDWWDDKWGKFKDFFGIGKDKKEIEVPIDIKPVDGSKKDIKDLVKNEPVQLEFEDASLGKISTKLIEVTTIKAKELNVEKILAESLTLVDIFADVLHVGEIETNSNFGHHENEWRGAGNDLGDSGTLFNDGAEINASKITTPLLQADLIKALTMQVNEIIAQLLTVTTIVSELLEVTKIVSELLQVNTIEARLLEVSKIVSDRLNVGDINADDLYLDDIYADTLHVGDIDGSISGLTDGIKNIPDDPTPTSFNWENTPFITPIDWSYYIPSKVDWSDYVPSFNWSEYIPTDGNVRWSQIVGLPSADDLYKLIGGKRISGTPSPYDTSSSNLNINDYDDKMKYVYDRLMKIIGNANGVAGLMGNLFEESRFNPSNLQDSYEHDGMDDQSYVKWANENLEKFIKDGKGFGLMQVTNSSRKKDFVDQLNGRSVDDITAQLDFIEYELNHGFKNVKDYLQNVSSPEDAAEYVMRKYEKPQIQDSEEARQRGDAARNVLEQYGRGFFGNPINLSDNSIEALSGSITNPLGGVLNTISGQLPNGNFWGMYSMPRYEGGANTPNGTNGLRINPSELLPSGSDFTNALKGVDWNKVFQKINWDKLLKKIDWNRLLQNVDLNKLLEKVDWEKIGEALADALNKNFKPEDLVFKGEDGKRYNDNNNLVKDGSLDNSALGEKQFPDGYLSQEDVANIHARLGKILADTKWMLGEVKSAFDEFDFAELFLSEDKLKEIEDTLDEVVKMFEDFVKDVEDTLKDFNFAENLIDLDAVDDQLEAVKDKIDDFLVATKQAFDNFKKDIENLFDGLFDDAFDKLEKQAEDALKKVLKVVETYVKKIKKKLDELKNAAKDIFKDLAKNGNDEWQKLYGYIELWVGAILEQIKKLKDAAKDMFKDLAKGVDEEWKKVADAVARHVKTILDEIAKLKNAADNLFAKMAQEAEQQWQALFDLVHEWVEKLIAEINRIHDTALNLFFGMDSAAEEEWNKLLELVRQKVADILVELDKLRQAALTMFDGLAEKADEQWKAVYDAVKRWIDEINKLLDELKAKSLKLFEGMVAAAESDWQKLLAMIQKYVGLIIAEMAKITDAAKKIFNGMVTAADAAWKALYDLIIGWVAKIKALLDQLRNLGNNLFKDMATNANTAFQNLYNIIVGWIERIKKLFNGLTQAFRLAIDGMSDAMNEEMREVYDAIDIWLARIAQLLQSFFANWNIGLADAVKRELDKAYALIVDWVNKVKKLLEDVFGGLKALTDGKLEVFGTVKCDCNCGKDNTHLDNNTKAKSENTRAVETLTNAIREWVTKCGDNTHLINNTNAKSKNTKAVEQLNNGIQDWINRCGDNTHLINNTNAKSKNTQATEKLITSISNLQGSLGSIKCECNCCGNCNGCDNKDSGGSHSNTTNNSSNTNTSKTSTVSNTQTSGTTGSNNGKIVLDQNGKKVPLYVNVGGKMIALTDSTDDNIKADVANGKYKIRDSQANILSDADQKAVQNYLKNTKGWGKNTSSGSSSGSGSGNGSNSGGKDTGVKTPNTPTSKDTNNSNNNNNKADTSSSKTDKDTSDKNKDKTSSSGGGSGSSGSGSNKEEKEKKEQKTSERLAVRVPTGDLKVTAKGYDINSEAAAEKYGVLDNFIANRNEANRRVEEWRKEAKNKGYLDTIKNSKYDAIKKKAQDNYDFLMANNNQIGTASYENALNALKSYADKAKAYDNAVKDSTKYNSADWKGKLFVPEEIVHDGKKTGYVSNAAVKAANEANKRATEVWLKNIKETYLPVIEKSGNATDKANVKQFISKLEKPTTSQQEKIAGGKKPTDTYYYSEYQKIQEKYKKAKNATKDTSSSKGTDTSKLSKDDQKTLNEIKKHIDNGGDIYFSTSGSYDKYLSPDIIGARWRTDKAKMKEIADFVNKSKLKLGGSASFGDLKSGYGQSIPSTLIKSSFEYWYKNRLLDPTKGYQMGGIPNAGEIFVARENGTPEFVGSFGNKTAVANNDQIVSAVANGVSMANDSLRNAIENQTNALENAIDRKNLDVQIGDRQIAEANRRGEKGLGQNFIS